MIIGSKSFIKEALQRLGGQSLQNKDICHRRVLASTTLDINEVVRLLSTHFNIPEDKTTHASPYKGYAVYLVRKHTPIPNTEIGRYFGNISFSAVSKIVTRLKAKMKEDKGL